MFARGGARINGMIPWTVNGEPFETSPAPESRKVPLEDRGHQVLTESSQGTQRVIKLNPFARGLVQLDLAQAGLAEHCHSDRPA